MTGEQVGSVQIDEAQLGGRVRFGLLKQAVVMYRASMRRATAATLGRGMVKGSTRKLYRQKGTGRARVGTVRTPLRRGGGRTFAKRPRDFSHAMPKKMRRLARDNAILAKLQANEGVVIEDLEFAEPKTKQFAAMLKALGADHGCLVALGEADERVFRSARNIPKVDIRVLQELNAFEILRRKRLLFTKEAFETLSRGGPGGQSGRDEESPED